MAAPDFEPDPIAGETEVDRQAAEQRLWMTFDRLWALRQDELVGSHSHPDDWEYVMLPRNIDGLWISLTEEIDPDRSRSILITNDEGTITVNYKKNEAGQLVKEIIDEERYHRGKGPLSYEQRMDALWQGLADMHLRESLEMNTVSAFELDQLTRLIDDRPLRRHDFLKARAVVLEIDV